jgi:hypothetical protein
MLPVAVEGQLREHLEAVRAMHARDLKRGGAKGRYSECIGAKVPECLDGVEMAVCISGSANSYRRGDA